MKSFAGFLLLMVDLWLSKELLEVAVEKILLCWRGQVCCFFDCWGKRPLLEQLISLLDPYVECSMVSAIVYGPSCHAWVVNYR